MAKQHLNRRRFMQSLGTAAGMGALPLASMYSERNAKASQEEGGPLLFVFAAAGGASIIDSYMPVAQSEVIGDPLLVNAYEDGELLTPPGSNIRCVAPLGTADPIYQFCDLYKDDMAVMAMQGTSVNHGVAQRRALTGAGVNQGRTIMEAMAVAHGMDLPIANCNMAADAYLDPGDDISVAAAARAEIVDEPLLYGVSTSAMRGQLHVPEDHRIRRAQAIREELDDASIFGQTFLNAERRKRYLEQRRNLQTKIEDAELIDKLIFFSEEQLDLTEYGLQQAEDYDQLVSVFPNLSDPIATQAAMAYVLAKYGASVALTVGPGFGTPGFPALAFDSSHSGHRGTQQFAWRTMLAVISGLITMLQDTPWGEGTMYDESVIYIATDFGRTRERPVGNPDPPADWGTGHHMNNGNLFISPKLKGNAVYGGVDPESLMTYGFDLDTGVNNEGVLLREEHLFSVVAQALGIEFTGREDMSAMML